MEMTCCLSESTNILPGNLLVTYSILGMKVHGPFWSQRIGMEDNLKELFSLTDRLSPILGDKRPQF